MTGLLQSILLFLCLAWKHRQARLGLDDFGRPVVERADFARTHTTAGGTGGGQGGGEQEPLLR